MASAWCNRSNRSNGSNSTSTWSFCDTLALLDVDGSDASSHSRADADFVGFDESADLVRDAAVLVEENRRDEQRGDDSQDQEPFDHGGPHHVPGY